MTAAFGKLLILKVNPAHANRFENPHAVGRIVRTAITRVGIHQNWQRTRTRHPVGMIAGFGQRHHTNIRQAAHRIRQHRAGQIKGVKL